MRFFQDNQNEITFLKNKKIENIFCVYWLNNKAVKSNVLDVIWIKLKDNNYWLRFFFDAGLCFGEKYSLSKFKDVYLEDIDNAHIYSFGDRYLLKDSVITSAKVEPVKTDEFININGVKLSFTLGSKQIIDIYSKLKGK